MPAPRIATLFKGIPLERLGDNITAWVKSGSTTPTYRTEEYYRPQPNVFFKQQNEIDSHLLDSKPPNLRDIYENSLVNYTGFRTVPMGDWDWKSAAHDGDSVTIESLGDAYEKLQKYTTDNPNSQWRLYLTPGGVRAWDVSQVMAPTTPQANEMFEKLNIDPMYAKISQKPRLVREEIEGQYKYKPIIPPAFWSRVSPKQGRENDFIAYYLGNVGNGLPNPLSQRNILNYHDRPIQKILLQAAQDPTNLAIPLLEQHLATVPKSFSEPIYRRLNL